MSFLRTLETARRSRFAAPVALLLGLAVMLTNEIGHQRALAVIASRASCAYTCAAARVYGSLYSGRPVSR